MPLNTSQLPTYQDTDLLTAYRWALANNAAGTTRKIGDREITFPSVKEIIYVIAWLEQRIQDDANAISGESGNTSVVHFRDPT